MDEETLLKVVEKIREVGPDRVIIGTDGEAVDTKRAQEAYGITPQIVFIRGVDGWSLGAELGEMEDEAYQLWMDAWSHFMMMDDMEPRPIEEY